VPPGYVTEYTRFYWAFMTTGRVWTDQAHCELDFSMGFDGVFETGVLIMVW